MKGMFISQVEIKLHCISFGHRVTINRLTLLQIRFCAPNVFCELTKSFCEKNVEMYIKDYDPR